MKPQDPAAEKKYLIRLVQSRFEWLKLSIEQAGAIHDYERNIEGIHVEGNYPSFWEEKEIESHYFRGVLDRRQFAKYQKRTGTFLSDYEASLIEEDKNAGHELAYASKLLAFYRDDMIPRLLEHRGKFPHRFEGRRKLEYLKDEFQIFLKVQWKETCIGHFRSVRNFQPNKLRVAQLWHELEKAYPTWYFFERKADEASKAIARSLLQDLGYYMKEYLQFIEKQSEDSQKTIDSIQEEFYPKLENKGWAVIEVGGDRSEKEKQEDAFLSYLLIDPGRYE